jgi:hypothetical protein
MHEEEKLPKAATISLAGIRAAPMIRCCWQHELHECPQPCAPTQTALQCPEAPGHTYTDAKPCTRMLAFGPDGRLVILGMANTTLAFSWLPDIAWLPSGTRGSAVSLFGMAGT